MGRRRTSLLDEVLELMARLPWWVGVLLAGLSYVVLHAMASRPVAPPAGSIPGPSVVVQAVVQGLAIGGQYLLPLICLAGAWASFVGRRRRQGLFQTASGGEGAEVLRDMTWREFELLVGEAFRRRGYQVHEEGGAQPDGGVDLVLDRAGQRYLVQCKHWKVSRVGVKVVREMFGVMAAQGAAGGFVVTSGNYTPEAIAFAHGRSLELMDGPALFALIRDLRTDMQHAPGTSPKAPNKQPADQLEPPSVPTCPKCQARMARRVARRGSTVGQAFWGCEMFPSCRGVRSIEAGA